MIPKILHYCWFGSSEIPSTGKKCMKTWKQFLPDYEWRLWNEENFDVNCNRYVREAYKFKEYRFVSDYARLKALYDFGGIYLDLDCKIIKDLFPIINSNRAFTGFGGDNKEILAAVLAFEPKNETIKECISILDSISYRLSDGGFDNLTINQRLTNILIKKGFIPNGEMQVVDNITIYPMTYFCPFSMIIDKLPDCKSKSTYIETLWTGKEIRKERSVLRKIIRKLKLNKVKNILFK